MIAVCVCTVHTRTLVRRECVLNSSRRIRRARRAVLCCTCCISLYRTRTIDRSSFGATERNARERRVSAQFVVVIVVAAENKLQHIPDMLAKLGVCMQFSFPSSSRGLMCVRCASVRKLARICSLNWVEEQHLLQTHACCYSCKCINIHVLVVRPTACTRIACVYSVCVFLFFCALRPYASSLRRCFCAANALVPRIHISFGGVDVGDSIRPNHLH